MQTTLATEEEIATGRGSGHNTGAAGDVHLDGLRSTLERIRQRTGVGGRVRQRAGA